MVNGPTNSHSRLRLFGQKEEDVRVVLFRDHHAWCPYCQKVWLWLEEHKVPYRIAKITMFCYGQKESWYKQIVPSGMLPAVQIDGRTITESDEILMALEKNFGPLNNQSMNDKAVYRCRQLERNLFGAWCGWLCRPQRSAKGEESAKAEFVQAAKLIEEQILSTPGPYLLEEFGTSDVIITPYVERMNASLFYYKNYDLRKEHPVLGKWFDAMESRETYRGTQSDFHTHCHDLPPQMGGCYFSVGQDETEASNLVDFGPYMDVTQEVNPDARPEPEDAKLEAVYRVLRHREKMAKVNPFGEEAYNDGMRAVLTLLMTGEKVKPTVPGADLAMRYVRDRISVPRDMPIWSAKHLRQACEDVAATMSVQKRGDKTVPVPFDNRRDQNPVPFVADTDKMPEGVTAGKKSLLWGLGF